MPLFSKKSFSKSFKPPVSPEDSCLTESTKQGTQIEATLFENVLQRSCSDFATLTDSSNWSSLAKTTKNMEFVWVPISPDKVGLLEDLELMRALQKRNKGSLDGVPGWILEGLAQVSGPVDWLVKVKTPSGLKKGQKFAFECNGVKVVTTYGGALKSSGSEHVYAMQSTANKIGDRELVWVDVAAADLDSLKQLELMSALERRNRGEQDGLPIWLQEGLAKVQKPVDWMVKVTLPQGVQRGYKISLNLNGEKVQTVFNGQPEKAATHNVFALLSCGKLAKPTKSASETPAETMGSDRSPVAVKVNLDKAVTTTRQVALDQAVAPQRRQYQLPRLGGKNLDALIAAPSSSSSSREASFSYSPRSAE